jgi:PAS domain S-box-containing protein
MRERADQCALLHLRALLKYTNDLVLVIDGKGKIVDANNRAVDLLPEHLVGSNIQKIFSGHDLSVVGLNNEQIVQSLQVTCVTKTDRSHPLLLTFVPIVEDSSVREIVVVGRDVREKNLLNERIDGLERRMAVLERENESLHSAKSGKDPSLAETLRKLETANEKFEDVNRRITKELEMASILQHSLVPREIPDHRSLRFAAYFKPMTLVGGDYFDVVDLGEGKRGLFIADVSGHGISSAFIAAMLKISLLNYAMKYRSPAAVLDRLNREYCRVIKTGEYLTAFYGVLNPDAEKLTYCGAGHPDALLQKRGAAETKHLPSEGFFIGMFEESVYREKSIRFEEGDRLLLYTDGVIEAFSEARNEQFGLNRLGESVKRGARRSPSQLLDGIMEDLKTFMGKSTFHDDLALLVAEYRKKGGKR